MRFGKLAVVTAVALLGMAATAQAAIVTVGSPLIGAFKATEFHNVGTVVQTALPEPGAKLSSPISGTVIRWRLLNASGGPFSLQVVRAAAGGAYTGIATGAPTPVAPTLGVQTFTTSLPIQAGDAIGLHNTNASDKLGVVSDLPGAAFLVWEPPLGNGQTLLPSEGAEEIEVGFNADIQPLPTVASVAPAKGSFKGGGKVVITGTDFTGATAVNFGTTPATSFTVDSETQITAISPKVTKPGPVAVTITTLAGTSAAAAGFRFEACVVPTLTGKSLKAAKRKLRKAHCKAGKVKLRGDATAKSGKVAKQGRKAGAKLPPGAKVGLTLD